MTKDTRRKIENRLEEIEEEEEEGQLVVSDVHSDVRVITDDMVDDSGSTIEEKVPEPEVNIISGGVTVVTSDMVDETGSTVEDRLPEDAPQQPRPFWLAKRNNRYQ